MKIKIRTVEKSKMWTNNLMQRAMIILHAICHSTCGIIFFVVVADLHVKYFCWIDKILKLLDYKFGHPTF